MITVSLFIVISWCCKTTRHQWDTLIYHDRPSSTPNVIVVGLLSSSQITNPISISLLPPHVSSIFWICAPSSEVDRQKGDRFRLFYFCVNVICIDNILLLSSLGVNYSKFVSIYSNFPAEIWIHVHVCKGDIMWYVFFGMLHPLYGIVPYLPQYKLI